MSTRTALVLLALCGLALIAVTVLAAAGIPSHEYWETP